MWRRRTDEDDTEQGVRTRKGRGWGPFSGGQLTAIILGVLLAVAFPVGAYAAVTGSNVFVTDATSGTRAGVTSAGKMKVDTGLSVYGLVPTLAAGGTVNAPTAAPGDLYTSAVRVGVGFASIGVPPAGKALVVQHMSIDNYVLASQGHFLDLFIGTPSCEFRKFIQTYDFDAQPEYREVSFGPGIAIPMNRALCARNYPDGVGDMYVHVTGYQVAANTVPTVAGTAAGTPIPERSK